MAGHNKWAQIKHKKAITDAKRSKVFTKILKLVQVEARLARGDMNSPSLRAAVEKARAANIPKENIERAIKGATDSSAQEKVVFEAYGPGGAAIIMEGLTDNNNRTSQEIKHLLSKHGAVLAAQGSALWAFSKTEEGYVPTTTIPISSDEEGGKLAELVEELEDHEDIQNVYTNAA